MSVSRYGAEFRPDTYAVADRASEPVSILAMLNAVLRQHRMVLLPAIVLALVVFAISLLSDKSYTSVSSFAPQARRQLGNLAGLAAQFGVAVPMGEPTQVPQFYADLIGSYTLRGVVVDHQYRVRLDSSIVQGNLVSFLDVPGRTVAARRDAAIRRLRTAMSITVKQKTGVVNVAVTAPSAELAREINAEILDEVNRFNVASRVTNASAERQFAETRLAEARTALRRAEEDLRNFRTSNHVYAGAPELELESDRLQREVSLRQQVYTTLATAYEQARMDEVRETPVIMIVEAPVLPIRRDSRGTIVKTIGAFLAALFIGAVIAVVRDRLRPAPRSGASAVDELTEFHILFRIAVGNVVRPWRLLRPARR